MAAVPPLSVVMPVHNKEPYLDEAVAGILAQSFGNFEFVILDDGSTDGSRDRLREWADRDARIRLILGARRSGPVESSNRVTRESRAPLVARMDADDRAHPDRLRLQMEALDADPEAVLVGSLCDTIDASGRLVRGPDYARLLRHSPFAPFPHTSIMFRRWAFDRCGGYRGEACRWEDVDLFSRLTRLGPVVVIALPLVSVRMSEASSRLAAPPKDFEQAMDRMYRTISATPPLTDERLVPEAFLPVAMSRVWNGRRPRVLGRLLRQARLGLNRASGQMLVWTLWAEINPRSLRAVLRALLFVRNRSARKVVKPGAVMRWRPPAKP